MKTITIKTIKIDENNLPSGHWWDEDGACYKAEKVDPETFGCTWYWMACNLKALRKGYEGQTLHPFYQPDLKNIKQQLMKIQKI